MLKTPLEKLTKKQLVDVFKFIAKYKVENIKHINDDNFLGKCLIFYAIDQKNKKTKDIQIRITENEIRRFTC